MTTGSGLSAGEAARQLGVAVTTIRTWDRRYGLGPERHEQGRHRRYGPRDMQRLRLMSRLVADGVPAAEAARLAGWARRPDRRAAPTPPATPRTPAAAPQVAGLRRAALTLDDEQLDRIVRQAVNEDVTAAWACLICPVLRDIGRRHARTGRHVDAEHLLSRAVSAALSLIVQPDGPASVLLACAPEEHHSLPLEALAAGLAARGARSRMLGARVPVAALESAIVRTGPRAVVLWAHASATADIAPLRAAMAARPRPALVAAAGPGWSYDRLPTGAQALTDFGQALDVLAEVACPPGQRARRGSVPAGRAVSA
jgi:DNA-binding transcriptional MerR regulator